MSQAVVYEMSLKDMLSPKIKEAEGHVNKLEGAIHSFGHTALKTMESWVFPLPCSKDLSLLNPE
jgi:hypothetical protein